MNGKGCSRSDFRMRMRQIAKSKRSSEMTIGTLVVIVLAVVVLVVLVLGFTMGWNSLWSKISPYIGGSGGGSNIDSVRNACSLLCNSAAISPSSKDEYCNSKKQVIIDSKTKISKTCKELESDTSVKLTSCGISC